MNFGEDQRDEAGVKDAPALIAVTLEASRKRLDLQIFQRDQ